MRYGNARYSSRVFIILIPSFYDFTIRTQTFLIGSCSWMVIGALPSLRNVQWPFPYRGALMAYQKLSRYPEQFIKSQIIGKTRYSSEAYPIETEHSFEVNRKWCHMWCQYRKITPSQVLTVGQEIAYDNDSPVLFDAVFALFYGVPKGSKSSLLRRGHLPIHQGS